VSKGPDAFRTISEVAEDLNLPQHVLRFWETRFTQIRPMKRGGGRRYYRPDDIDLLRGIRHLLYGEGYTIKGVQRILKEQGARFVIGAGRGEAVDIRRDPSDEIDEAGYGEVEYADDGSGLEPHFDENGAVHVAREEAGPGPFAQARRFVGRLMQEDRPAPSNGDARLGQDEVQALQGTLADLLEMKRLLDQAR
jgi:DNA-binding transcriptional MerR regulator